MHFENRNPDAPLKAFASFWWGLAAFVAFGVLGMLAFNASGGARDDAYAQASANRLKLRAAAEQGQDDEYARIAPDLGAAVAVVASAAAKTEKPAAGTEAHRALIEAQMAAAAAAEGEGEGEAAAEENAGAAEKPDGEGATVAAAKPKADEGAAKAVEPVKIILEPIPNVMKYKDTALEVPAGKPVELTFNNTDVLMHNVLVLKPGTRDKVGALADAMLVDPKGMEKGYVPESDDIIAHTKLLMFTQSDTIKFTLEAGEYPFICTFPGHWRIMQGTITAK